MPHNFYHHSLREQLGGAVPRCSSPPDFPSTEIDGDSIMSDDVVPRLAPKKTIPLPFVEPGDDLLRVGEEPPVPLTISYGKSHR